MAKLELIQPPPKLKAPEDLLDAHDVAQMPSVNISWVHNHCTRVEPILPHLKLGSGRYSMLRFKREDILKFIEENMVTSLKKR
jgi:hypothetical protein